MCLMLLNPEIQVHEFIAAQQASFPAIPKSQMIKGTNACTHSLMLD